MGIPDVITREHILRTLTEIDELGVQKGRSKNYCLVYEGKHYPPKYVISKVAKYAIGRELKRWLERWLEKEFGIICGCSGTDPNSL